MSHGTAPLAKWDPTYLHLAPAVYVSSATAIYTPLSCDAILTLIRPFGAGDAWVEIIRCCKTVYVPEPYIGLLLGANFTLVEDWNRLQGSIVNTAAEDACRPFNNWIRATIARAVLDNYSTLILLEPSATLRDALLLQHLHRLLLSHMPGLYPSINQAAGTRISKKVREVAVKL